MPVSGQFISKRDIDLDIRPIIDEGVIKIHLLDAGSPSILDFNDAMLFLKQNYPEETLLVPSLQKLKQTD